MWRAKKYNIKTEETGWKLVFRARGDEKNGCAIPL
jgi:hypothetical protein